MDNDEKKKILLAIERASGLVQMDYICAYCGDPIPCGIDHPCKQLKELENDGYIDRCQPTQWSPSGFPRYKISSKGRQMLKTLVLQHQ